MKLYLIVIISGLLCTSVELSPARTSHSTSTKVSDAIIVNQTKRDLSLSYAATDIDSKQGTRIKTITVIKNVGNKKHQPLNIDPELHKNEEWGSSFRDNFDSYGKIPEVPDIDELFDFVNKKPEEKEKEKEGTEAPAMMEVEKPVREEPVEEKEPEEAEEAEDEAPVEKIKGDAELISNSSSSSSTKSSTGKKSKSNNNNNNNSNKKQKAMSRSQSLSVEKYRVEEPASETEVNSSTEQQRFDKYIEEIPNKNLGYDYAKPCVHSPPASIPVADPSGRTYDIPVNNNNDGKRYIAPAISKRTQVQPQNNQQLALNSGGPITFPVNSFPPPQTPNLSASNSVIAASPQWQQQQQTGGFATNQGGYVAPSLRNGLVTSRAPPSVNVYSPGAINFRSNSYGGLGFKSNFARSRGLKY